MPQLFQQKSYICPTIITDITAYKLPTRNIKILPLYTEVYKGEKDRPCKKTTKSIKRVKVRGN